MSGTPNTNALQLIQALAPIISALTPPPRPEEDWTERVVHPYMDRLPEGRWHPGLEGPPLGAWPWMGAPPVYNSPMPQINPTMPNVLRPPSDPRTL